MKRSFAEVIPLVSLPYKMGFFDYQIPPGKTISVGDLVNIDFRNRKTLGLVGKLKAVSDYKNVKTINKQVDPKNITTKQLEFAGWLAQENYTSIAVILKSIILPPYKKDRPTDSVNKYEPKLSSSYVLPLNLANNQTSYFQYGFINGLHLMLKNLIGHCLTKNKTVLAVFPEIYQIDNLIESLPKNLKDSCLIIHSKLTRHERLQARQLIKDKQVKVIVGTAISLFEPWSNLDYIICNDESNETYKQVDRQPHWHAHQAITFLAKQYSSSLLFTGRSPSLPIYQNLKTGSQKLHRLKDSLKPSKINIIDLNKSKKGLLIGRG